MASPDSGINVTPLIDVVLVLLIIFMVVTPLLEKNLEVKVPEQSDERGASDALVVTLSAEGGLAIDSEPIADEEYLGGLRRRLTPRRRSDRQVFFISADGASYGKLVAALDGARQAGAESLGLMTELPVEAPRWP